MTVATRVVAIVFCLMAGLALVALAQDRGTRSARWFTAVGFWALSVTSLVAMVTHPLEQTNSALLVAGIARVFQSWVALGVVLIARQRWLLARGGLR